MEVNPLVGTKPMHVLLNFLLAIKLLWKLRFNVPARCARALTP